MAWTGCHFHQFGGLGFGNPLSPFPLAASQFRASLVKNRSSSIINGGFLETLGSIINGEISDQSHRHIRLSLIDLAAFCSNGASLLIVSPSRPSFSHLRSASFNAVKESDYHQLSSLLQAKALADTETMSHFIRVLIGEWRTKLPIPKLFVSSFSLTPKTVILVNASKRLWMVGMDKEEEDPKELYFKKNWPKFVNDNALEAADFLIFKFDGNSTFEVVICGKSACDKMLESQAKAHMNQKNHKHSHNRLEASTRDRRENWKGKAVIDLETKEERVDFVDFGTYSQEMWDETWSSESHEDEEEDDEEYEESDKSDDIGEGSNLGSMPPSFTVQILASAKKGCMCVPTKFFKKYLRNEKQEVEIETVKGIWTVTLLPHKKRTRTFARFSRGWSAFARRHHLETGDALLFKMIRRGKCPKFIVQRQREVSR